MWSAETRRRFEILGLGRLPLGAISSASTSFTLASAVLLLAGTLWLAACHFVGRERDECAVGVAQRLITGIQYSWLVAVAVRLWRIAGQAQANGDILIVVKR